MVNSIALEAKTLFVHECSHRKSDMGITSPEYLNANSNAYRYTTPLATKPCKAFCWPASLLTHCAFRIAGKVAFTPVVLVVHWWQFLIW